MMDDSVDAFSRLANERGRGEELVAEGNSKTDSASNSNDDKHVRIEAGAGRVWNKKKIKQLERVPRKTHYKVNASAAGQG